MELTPESQRIRNAVADTIIAAFEAQLCPVSLSVKVIKEAHEACKVERDDAGSMIVPDHKVRLTAAQLALGLRGHVVKQSIEGNFNVKRSVTDLSDAELAAIAASGSAGTPEKAGSSEEPA